MAIEIKNKKEFEGAIKNNKMLVVDFFAPWCGPCKMFGAELKKIDEAKECFTIAKVNVDDLPELAAQFNVSSIPHVVILKDQTPVHYFNGFKPASELVKMVKKFK